jgi:hypothetical protein
MDRNGSTFVGEVEWDDESYSFNLTAVWRNDSTGQFEWADDSGCSCPMPFENLQESDVVTGSKYDVLNYLAGHYNSVKAMPLIERIQAMGK